MQVVMLYNSIALQPVEGPTEAYSLRYIQLACSCLSIGDSGVARVWTLEVGCAQGSWGPKSPAGSGNKAQVRIFAARNQRDIIIHTCADCS